MTSAGSVGGDDRLRLFLRPRARPTTPRRPRAPGSAEHLARTAGSCRGSTSTSRSPSSAAGRPAELAGDRRRAARRPSRSRGADRRSSRRASARRGASGCSSSTTQAARATRARRPTCTRGSRRSASTGRESRPWLPHVTVLRFRERPRLDPPLPETGTFVPSDAAAYLSRLHPTGARYEVLERVSLSAGG